ncbi:YdcF family protein [Bosea sp. (in: a-proteobacteria)]|uniref:YdcF family protein n=1 Tax=Bosea sp. (in: a-proteobacteria) TaxID=1871050 RepID=UPI002601D3AA|nr:YdcF family protein [Bosea sp. (in: a-proteobacteria)]MCO5093439.1 YdcF family protein [Bosea sp. (in: a-proteobacteria)]
MFFILSKLVWFLLSPVNLAILLGGFSALLAFTRFARPARWVGLISLTALVLMAFSPLSLVLIRPLEDRFPQQDARRAPVTGIVVLGGAVGVARGDVVVNALASRMTKAVELARLHPQAKIVFAGGTASLISTATVTEADGAKLLFEGLGLDPARLIFDDKSRNTRENAVFARRLVDPKPGERWLLVTSGWHMPRAIGVFRKAGFAVEAFPVDFWSSGEARDFVRIYARAPRALEIADIGFKEWVGLVAYRLAGYTDALFPGP